MKHMRILACLAVLGVPALAACDEESAEDHGTVQIRLNANVPSELPFSGTTRIDVQVTYKDCLEQFYTTTNNQFAFDGVEGAEVLALWQPRLCDQSEFGESVACEIGSIQQITSGGRLRLNISYDVSSDDIEGRTVVVGPLPTRDLVAGSQGCEVSSPSVEVSPSSAQGFDSGNVNIWEGSNLSGDSLITNQGAPAKINVRRN